MLYGSGKELDLRCIDHAGYEFRFSELIAPFASHISWFPEIEYEASSDLIPAKDWTSEAPIIYLSVGDRDDTGWLSFDAIEGQAVILHFIVPACKCNWARKFP